MNLTVNAYAKINLSLDITGKRQDGYHLLETVMQSVSIGDTVCINTNTNGNITVDCTSGILNSDNICYKAAELFFKETLISNGADIKVDKNIPVAAGMGGGSADAAAVLFGLNKIYGYPLDNKKLNEIALMLGADVPFFLTGGTLKAEGIGEILSKIENELDYCLVIIKNSSKPSTKEMYAKIDARNEKEKPQTFTSKLQKAINNNDYDSFCKFIANDFDALWDNREIKQDLTDFGAQAVCLSGSGPTVFAIFKHQEHAQKAFNNLKQKYKNIYLAKPLKYSLLTE